MAGRLLIAGGKSDPSLRAIESAAQRLGFQTLNLWTDTAAITFDPLTTALWLDAERVVGISAAFLRADVFGAGPNEAITVIRGWLACHPEIKRPNAFDFGRPASVNKLAALATAHRHGLRIPVTMAGNDQGALAAFAREGPAIRKPVSGGDYCRPLTAEVLLGRDAIIVQEQLAGPELRVYRIGGRLFAFTIHSAALDYRTDTTATITPLSVPEDLTHRLVALTDAMGLDFCASDFKTCPRSGEWVYLETNAAPMFAAFGSDLADAIVVYLMPQRSGQGQIAMAAP